MAIGLFHRTDRNRFKPIPLITLFASAGALIWIGVKDGAKFEFLLIGLALLSTLVQVELAWSRGTARAHAMGTGSESTKRARTLNYLTYDLGLALAVAGGALALAVIDSLGFALQQWKIAGNFTYAQAFSGLGGVVLAGLPLIRWFAVMFRDSQTGRPTFLGFWLKPDMFAGAIGIMLLILPLVTYSFVAHATYQGGDHVRLGLGVTIAASVLTVLFALPSAASFVNRSSLSQAYAARLARSYLGASNPIRHRPDGAQCYGGHSRR